MEPGWQLKQYDESIKTAREISRNVVYKILLFAAGTLSFSVTMFSAFPDNIDISKAFISWYVLVATIIIGFATILLHGRVLYAKSWKTTNTDFSIKIAGYPLKYKFMAIPLAIFSLIFPANMVLNKINSFKKPVRQQINQYTIHEIAWIEHRIPWLENVTFISFVIGLIFLMRSVQI